MDAEHLHIAVSSDSNYLEQALVLINSVIDSNRKCFKNISIHFLSYNVKSEQLSQIQTVVEGNGCHFEIYDLSDIRQRLGIAIPNTIAISAYSRLFLSSIIAPSIHKIIYMDVDAINVQSLSPLWSLDIFDYSVCGVLDDVDVRAKINIGLDANSLYVNSGFLLINLEYWRRNHLQSKFIDFLVSHDGNVFHHDQGIINAICHDSLKILPPQYNVMTNFFMLDYRKSNMNSFYSQDKVDQALSTPVFIHYTPGVVNRPWCKNCKHPLTQKYLSFRAKAGLPKDNLTPDNRPLRVRFLCWTFFNARPLYNAIIVLRSKLSKKI